MDIQRKTITVKGREVDVMTDCDPTGWWIAVPVNRGWDASVRGCGPTEQDAIDALMLDMEG